MSIETESRTHHRSSLKFRILGPLEAVDELGVVRLGGIKPRAMLAYLLLNANEAVSADALARALWGEDAPAGAVKTVQVHVSRLRKALGPDVVTTTPTGYRLSLHPDDLDATRFERLVEDGRRALASGDPQRAQVVFRDALALWRGPALEDVAFEPFAQEHIYRLEEWRLTALEARVDADLTAGQHAALVSELRGLVDANPVRERLSGQLMLALYRCGRQAEALEVYSRVRVILAQELGLEPGPALKDLQIQILHQAPALDLADKSVAAHPVIQTPAPRPRTPARTAKAHRLIAGRSAELGELRGALDDAREGRGSLYMLFGDIGIGKTRLAEAIVQEATEHDYNTVWGSAWEDTSSYWPWIQIMRQLLDMRPPKEGRDEIEEIPALLASVVPNGGNWLSTRDPMPSLRSDTARFTAFDSVASFLRTAAERQPLVLVLDDLHAADVPSIQLLQFIARGLHGARILAIATCRTDITPHDSNMASALVDLARHTRPLTITGLSRDEVLELVAMLTPQQLPEAFVDRLHVATEGNPLFVNQIMQQLKAEGALSAPDALEAQRLPVPATVRETVRSRLDLLQPEVIHAMSVASVVGVEFRIDTLAPVIGEQRPAVLHYLDAAAKAGLIRELSGTLGSYRFTHALMRQMLYDELSMQDRAILHGRVGEAIIQIHGAGDDARLAELAHHFVAAAPAGNTTRAITYAARAGKHALELKAYEEAIRHFGDALRVLELEPQPPTQRGAILFALGQAEMLGGRRQSSRATLRRAAEDARRHGDADLLARLALASASSDAAAAHADQEDLIPLIREALDQMASEDSALRAQLLARLAMLYDSSAPARRESLMDAIAMARRIDDPVTLAYVLFEAYRATPIPDSPDHLLPCASTLYTLAEQLGNEELAMAAHSWRIHLLLELGEMTLVDRDVETFERAAARRHPRGEVQALMYRCGRAIVHGRFADAEAVLDAVAAYPHLLEQDPLLTMRFGSLAFAMCEAQGRLGGFEAAVRHFVNSQPAMPGWRCGLLGVLLQAGHETELRHEYNRLAAENFDALRQDDFELLELALLTEVCAYFNDRNNASVLRSMLTPHSGRNVISPEVAYHGPVDRYLAMLAVTEGDDESAAAWFSSARELAKRMDARPMVARLSLDEATSLRERDPPRAAVLAAEAAAAAAELGMQWLAVRAHEVRTQALTAQ